MSLQNHSISLRSLLPIGNAVGIDCALISCSQGIADRAQKEKPRSRFLQNLDHHHGEVVHLRLYSGKRRNGLGDSGDQGRRRACFLAAYDFF